MTAPSWDVGSFAILAVAFGVPWARQKTRVLRLRNPLLVSLLCLGVGAWSWLWKGRT